MHTRIQSGPQRAGSSDPEAGFMLVWVVLLASLMLMALAVAAPLVAKDMQREKELESEHRAEQYVRAIRLFYLKNRTYPVSIEALENTNNVRYLRKQYVDPLTGKSDWRIIHVGENKTTVKGFFGQPLGGLNTSGAGSSLGSASNLSSSGLGGTPSSTVSGGSALSAGFTGATIGGSTPAGSTAGTSATGSSTFTRPVGSSDGVGQIMGVGTSKTGDSILNPNQQTTYETWEFIYDPKIELLYRQANILGGPASVNSQPPSSMTTTNPGSPSNTPGGSSNPPAAPTTPPPNSPQ